MKNSIKYSFCALVLAASVSACSGGHDARNSDSLKADTSAISGNDKDHVSPAPGTNGSAISADTGLDRSGSGGTDTAKSPKTPAY
jgi:hypothetical protein